MGASHRPDQGLVIGDLVSVPAQEEGEFGVQFRILVPQVIQETLDLAVDVHDRGRGREAEVEVKGAAPRRVDGRLEGVPTPDRSEPDPRPHGRVGVGGGELRFPGPEGVQDADPLLDGIVPVLLRPRVTGEALCGDLGKYVARIPGLDPQAGRLADDRRVRHHAVLRGIHGAQAAGPVGRSGELVCG